MLAQLEKPTNDFFALARYLVNGRTQPTPANRVAWVLTQNLPTSDAIDAATLMTATAELSTRCRNACYHTIIAWAKDERPTPETMQEIATRTLDLAGLAEHQALVMGHGDKAHVHLHMMINRVHPDTGRAWSTSNDYRRFDRIMRQLSDDYGFQYVPAHAFNPDLTDDLPTKPNSNAAYAAKRGANTARPQWSSRTARQLGAAVSENLDHATSWNDIEFAFAEFGVALEPKGTGLIAGSSKGYVKFSSLGLTPSALAMARKLRADYEHRRHISRPPTRKPWWHLDDVDIARAIGTQNELREAIRTAKGRRLAKRAKLPLIRRLMAELLEQVGTSSSLTSVRIRKSKWPRLHHNERSCRRRSRQYHKLSTGPPRD